MALQQDSIVVNTTALTEIGEAILNDIANLSITEGGFLSGRSPFTFNEKVPLPTFIIQLLIIVIMSRLVKLVLSPLKQPAVISEIISGILLGPTALGHVPHYMETMFPQPSLPFLSLMSNFGLVLFLFLVGLELDPRMLKKSIKKSLTISIAGMMLPFAGGMATSYALYVWVEHGEHKVSFTTYFLFLGVAMAITAFPVLARILTELDLLKTKVGGITVSAAAIDDATSWCLLALVISLINAGSGLVALYVFLIGLGYSAFLILAVRPIYIRILRKSGAFSEEPSQFVMFLTLSLVFISAFITDAIGIHAIFGGFLAGIIMPHEGGFAYHVTSKLEDIVSVLFLPIYFALSGLRTQIGTLNDATSWGLVVLVILVACCGKICGCTLAARASRMNWRESMTVGVLMNCKGLVELIVLNLGYDAKVICDKTFAIMVIMAIVTTFLTVPLVRYLYPPRYHDSPKQPYALKTTSSESSPEPSILVSVNKIEQVPSILSVIDLLESRYKIVPDGNETPRIAHHTCLPQHDEKQNQKLNKTKLVVNALRLIEITERDSSVMLQTSSEALRDDPVMKMLQTFCEITSLDIRGLIKVVTMKKFAETLLKAGEEVNASYIIVPWAGCGSLIEDTSIPIQQLFQELRRQQSFHTPLNHSNFLQDLLVTAQSAKVLVLVDRGLELKSPEPRLVPYYQHVFMPFFGGPDDRAALEIVMGIAPGNVMVSVMRFRTAKNQGKVDVSNLNNVGSDLHILAYPDWSSAECSADVVNDLMLLEYFGSTEGRSCYPNVTYLEVESSSPISAALRYTENLSTRDLIVVGKGMSTVMGALSRAGDPERRKALGDVAEAILSSPCTASVLVVQERKIKS